MKRNFREEPARWVAKTIVGLLLCRAFVEARTVGVTLRVNTIDGKAVTPQRKDDNRVSVDVFDSVVRKAWV